jgi:hypothetical protein
MQFGKIHGVALIVLGLILIFLQVNFALAGRSDINPSAQGQPAGISVQQAHPHRLGPLAGIVGAVSLLAGLAVFVTAGRRDEPDPQHAVK